MTDKEKFNVAVLTNITAEPFFSQNLAYCMSPQQANVNVYYISYNDYWDKKNSFLFSQADIIIICLNIEYLYPNLQNDIILCPNIEENIFQVLCDDFYKVYSHIKKESHAQLIWIGTEDYCYHEYACCLGYSNSIKLIDNINLMIKSLVRGNDVFLDLKSIIAKIGIDNVYDNKNKYRWNNPYTKELWSVVSNAIYKQYLISNGITKKCIILDCDNVLWGGILSEDGIERLQLGGSGWGRSYQDFQRYMLYLHNHGVIVTICSKNDIEDVLHVFREHNEMILREEHIAYFCVNWDNKAVNIKKISEILNIDPSSMVFIDDSDIELDIVKTAFPDITTVKYAKNNVYKHLNCFNLKSNHDLETIRQRNRVYQTNEARRKLELESPSFEAFLQSLDIQIDIHEASPLEFARISELSQRTNKCTNGKRFTIEELIAKQKAGYRLYSVFVRDKYSNLGLVGSMGIHNNILDLFCLSCRALGRNVELEMLDFINKNESINNLYYNTTSKNHDLYEIINSVLKL